MGTDEQTRDDERTAPPRAPLRVMQIVAELAAAQDGISLGRLSQRLEMPKTSLFSLLRSLESGGYVISENGLHRLGQEAFNLAGAIRSSAGFPNNLRGELERLQAATGETTILAVPARDWSHVVYADVIEATSWLRFSANVGAHRPMHSTSLGLVLFAYADAEQQRQYLAGATLTAVTPRTITTRKALLEFAKTVRSQGYVMASASIEGATGIAAPVFDAQGHIAAAVGFAGLTPRMQPNVKKFSALVIDTASRMSMLLGHAI